MSFAVRTSLDDERVDIKIFSQHAAAYSHFMRMAVSILDGRMLRRRATGEPISAVAVELLEAESNDARRAKAEVDAGRARPVDSYDDDSGFSSLQIDLDGQFPGEADGDSES